MSTIIRQRGIALIMALFALLLLTGIGFGSSKSMLVRTVVLDARAAGG